MNTKGLEGYLYAFLYILGIGILGYFLPRTSTYPLLAVYSVCFILYWRLYRFSAAGWDWKNMLVLAVVLRLVLLSSVPLWSEDYARFLWDGQLIVQGYNPYSLTPTEAREQLPDSSGLMAELFVELNSPDYHSVYPPSNQLVFALAAFLGDSDILCGVILLRLILFAFEILAFYLIYLLLRLSSQPSRKLLLYALNPLVIMEITGNLHFEGMMLTMILAGIYFLEKRRFPSSGALLAAAAAVKLSPMMLFPAFLKKVPRRSIVRFSVAALLVFLLGLGPLVGVWSGFSQSLRLYNNTFEFNASIYYLLRQMGYWFVGYNTIEVLGPLLKLLTLGIILGISFRGKSRDTGSLLETILLVYWVYFLLSTVVHPWYIVPAIAVSVLTERRAFILWSFLIILSYQAYQVQPYKESTWFLFLQYACVGVALWREYYASSVLDGMFGTNEAKKL